jgi:hypothetical protein
VYILWITAFFLSVPFLLLLGIAPVQLPLREWNRRAQAVFFSLEHVKAKLAADVRAYR